jgi:hypothetical protein
VGRFNLATQTKIAMPASLEEEGNLFNMPSQVAPQSQPPEKVPNALPNIGVPNFNQQPAPSPTSGAPAVSPDNDLKQRIKSWVKSQYAADHGGETNPQQADQRWFADSAASKAAIGLKLEEPPVMFFWQAAKEALSEAVSSDGASSSLMPNPKERSNYIAELVRNAKLSGSGQSQSPESQPKPSASGPKHWNDDSTTFVETFGETIRKRLDNRSSTGQLADKYPEVVQDKLNDLLGINAKGNSNASLFFANGKGWPWVNPQLQQKIVSAFQEEGYAVDESSAAKFISTDNSAKHIMESRFDGELSSRLTSLVNLCSNNEAKQKQAIQAYPDLQSAYVDQNAMHTLSNTLQEFGIKYVSFYLGKYDKMMNRRKGNERIVDLDGGDESGSSRGGSLQNMAAPKSDSHAESPYDEDEQEKISTAIRTVLPQVQGQLRELAGHVWNIGNDISRYIRRMPASATEYKETKKDKAGNIRPKPIREDGWVPGKSYETLKGSPTANQKQQHPDMDEVGVKHMKDYPYKTDKEAGKFSLVFNVYCQIVADELFKLADDDQGTRLIPLLVEVAKEQNLLPSDLASRVQDRGRSQVQTDSGQAVDVTQDPWPKVKGPTLGDESHSPSGISAVNSHSQYGKLWNRSQYHDTQDEHGKVGLSYIAAKLNIRNLVSSDKFGQLLQRTASPRQPNMDSGSAEQSPATFPGGKSERTSKGGMNLKDGELRQLKRKMSQTFSWWAPMMMVPEIMGKYPAEARQAIMDALPSYESYKTGHDVNGQGMNVYLYYYLGVFGIENAPAVVYAASSYTKPEYNKPEPGEQLPSAAGDPVNKQGTLPVKMTPMAVARYLYQLQLAAKYNRGVPPITSRKPVPTEKLLNKQHRPSAEAVNQIKSHCDFESRLIRLAIASGQLNRTASADNQYIGFLLDQVRGKISRLLEFSGLE